MTRKFHTFMPAVCIALCVGGLTACTGESKTGKTDKTDNKTSEVAKEEPKKGGDSPEDVYAQVKTLYEAETLDTQAFAELWSPPFRKLVCGQMVIMAGFVMDKDKQEAGTKALEALMKKHGMKKPEGKVNLSKAAEAVGPMMADVSDTAACWKDIMDWLIEYSSEVGKKLQSNKPIGDLTDLETKGDFAMAKGKQKSGEKEIEKSRYFQKVDGRWYLDDSPEAKKAFREDDAKTDK